MYRPLNQYLAAGLALLLFALSSCSAIGPSPKGLGALRTVDYTARIIDGRIFVSLNESPDRLIGPFTKIWGRGYQYVTVDCGIFDLSKRDSGEWILNTGYIQTPGFLVDGSVLEKWEAANQALLPTPTAVTVPAAQDPRQP